MRNDTMTRTGSQSGAGRQRAEVRAHGADVGDRRPHRGPPGWWLLGAAGLVAVLAALGWGLASITGLVSTVDGWERAEVPGEVEVSVDEPVEMVVRSETSGAIRWGRPDGSLDVAVAGPQGEAVAVDEVGFAGEYRIPGRASRAVATFEADAPGTYRVTATNGASPQTEFSVGEPLWPGGLAGLGGAAALGAAGFLALIGGAIGVATARGRHGPAGRCEGSAGASRPRTGSATRGVGRLVAYTALTLGLTWAVWVPALLLLGEQAMPLVMLGAFGPAAAAVIMVRAEGGSIRGWLRRTLLFRVSKRWYAAALAIPFVEPVVVGAVVAAGGGPVTFAELTTRLPSVLAGFVMVLLVGGGQEEFGWRGYLLPRLQSRISPLLASVAIGVLWAVWHLPLFTLDMSGYTYESIPFAAYVPVVVGMSVVLTWLFNHTGGSVALAMILHAAFNSWDNLAPVPASLQLDGQTEVLAQVAVVAAYGLLAVALVATSGTRLGAPAEAEPEQAARRVRATS